jgi:hypothetical protein
MPCASVHLHLAGRLLEAWDRSPSDAPFRQEDPEARAAFLSGAMAPDAGFVPGTKRTMSEFAHHVRPGDLARALWTAAATGPERAFAAGWACHVLGDVEFHPLVGRSVGERLHGDRTRRVDTHDDLATHVSLEVGLDLALRDVAAPEIPASPPRAWASDPGRARFLTSALEGTYGVRWERARLVRDQARSAWMVRWWPTTLALVDREGLGGAFPGLLDYFRDRADPTGPARGLLRPERPPRWVLDELLEGAEGFASRFGDAMWGDFQALGNRSLETGVETPPGSGHAATDAAWEELGRARGTGGAGL